MYNLFDEPESPTSVIDLPDIIAKKTIFELIYEKIYRYCCLL